MDTTIPTAPPPVGEVHLYEASLEQDDPCVERFLAFLSPAERLLANRRVTPELRRRAILSRGFLRRALGGALGCSPQEVAIHLGPHGKPYFVEPEDSAKLDFNLTHTGDHWLLALTATGPIGLDAETPRDETDWDALVERYFSAAEGAAFRLLPERRRKEAFFRTWASKEAFLKARGSGLATPLRDFDVEVDPERPVHLIDVRIAEEHADAWWLHEVESAEVPTVIAGRGDAPKVRSYGLAVDEE